MSRIAIIEDDSVYQETLRNFTTKYAKEKAITLNVQVYDCADTFLSVYQCDYDIILMDIEMPGTDGMEAAKKIRMQDDAAVIMFITNMAHYAIKGYEVGALDFVLKPIQYYNFSNKMDRALQLAENRSSVSVMLQTTGGIVKLNSKEIHYVEVQNHILNYHTSQGNYQVRGSLKAVEEQLPAHMFAKCSNWCLVGLNHVLELKDDTVIVAGEALQMSRRCKKNFTTALIKSIGRS